MEEKGVGPTETGIAPGGVSPEIAPEGVPPAEPIAPGLPSDWTQSEEFRKFQAEQDRNKGELERQLREREAELLRIRQEQEVNNLKARMAGIEDPEAREKLLWDAMQEWQRQNQETWQAVYQAYNQQQEMNQKRYDLAQRFGVDPMRLDPMKGYEGMLEQVLAEVEARGTKTTAPPLRTLTPPKPTSHQPPAPTGNVAEQIEQMGIKEWSKLTPRQKKEFMERAASEK